MASRSDRLALIAGSTQMPVVVATEARKQGIRVLAAGIRGITEPRLEDVVDDITWFDWGGFGGFFDLLAAWRADGVEHAVMAGKVEQQRIYDRESGGEIDELLAELPARHTDQLLGMVAEMIESAGITVIPSTSYLDALIPSPGVLGARRPTELEEADVEHGWAVAKALGGLDIGQTVVVKERAIVAVEAMEGTDACIRRAADLAGPGTVVVKVAKPDQDLRFDVPVLGETTLTTMVECDAAVLALQAGCTVLFDRERTVARADEAGIAMLARADD